MINELAANFELKDQNGNSFELYKNPEKKLLVFYPKDNTTICAAQLTNYSININLFTESNIRIVAINIGDVQSHKTFCDELESKFPILSDADKTLSRQYKALNLLGINKRKLVLINTDKRIVYEKSTPYFLFISSERIINELKRSNIEEMT